MSTSATLCTDASLLSYPKGFEQHVALGFTVNQLHPAARTLKSAITCTGSGDTFPSVGQHTV